MTVFDTPADVDEVFNSLSTIALAGAAITLYAGTVVSKVPARQQVAILSGLFFILSS
jgi:hypothetical protein